jgi:exonuclease VII large subunit
MECQYCKKTFSSKSSLNNHQKTAKYCIKLQNNTNEILCFNCDFCEKIFTTKQVLFNHLQSCKNKDFKDKIKEKEAQFQSLLKEKEAQFQNVLKEKEAQFQSLLKDIEHYKKRLETQEDQIKELQERLERIANKAIERPTHTTTNNTTNNLLNITSCIDFNDIDKIKDTIENKLNINHVVDGQKGLARFVKDNLLTDQNGKLSYLCSDPSRHVFRYKDETGEIKKDVEAKKLTSYILEGGIRSKSADIGNEWCKDDDGDIDMTRFSIMMEQQESIMKLRDDNNSFKRELASITSL